MDDEEVPEIDENEILNYSAVQEEQSEEESDEIENGKEEEEQSAGILQVGCIF